MQARITGIGSYLPKKVLTNEELSTLVDTSDEWIVSRTGIRERRVAEDTEFSSTMGTKAAERALTNAGISAGEVDLILVMTASPDYLMPSTAALIQHNIGANQVAAVDMQAACSGYLYGLSCAKAYIESGMARCVLMVASEKMSSYLDYTDRSTCILFGDGASAAIVQGAGTGLSIDSLTLGADGSLSHLIKVPIGGTFQMEGKEVFKHAVRSMKLAIEKLNIPLKEIDWVVPHQANLRIHQALVKQLGIAPEKVVKTVEKYGNTSASSVGIALDELLQNETIHDKEKIVLVAFGAGLTWGAAVLEKISK